MHVQRRVLEEREICSTYMAIYKLLKAIGK